jgi:hypothetical protein
VSAEVGRGRIAKASSDLLRTYFPAAASVVTRARLEIVDGGCELSLAEDARQQVATILAAEREALEQGRVEAERREQEELNAETARLALPGGGAAVRDLRYITALRRDIARSHKLLAMLQARATVDTETDQASGEGDGNGNEPGDHS